MQSDRAHQKAARIALACGLLLTLGILRGSAIAEGDVHWTYSGERGPKHWGELSESFAACRDGRSQSPIDIVDSIELGSDPIAISHAGSTRAVTNNGHTLQVDVGPGSSLRVDGQAFALQQFHLHSPSEHRIRGESFPLEAHFVHANDQGELAVVAVLFRTGASNASVAKLGAIAPRTVGGSEPIILETADLGILPAGRSHYRYSGSLTTPPCTEGVRWLVMEVTASISSEQVASFVSLIGEDARGPQPLNGRRVFHRRVP